MKLTFKKGFDGDYGKLPRREVEGAVVFKEPENIAKFSIIANSIAVVIMFGALVPIALRYGINFFGDNGFTIQLLIGALLSLAVLFPHEILHALCFKEEVEMYTYLKKGFMFVFGTESMSKARFVFMSLLPNICFGVIPYALWFVFPSQIWLGIFGAMNLGAGAGDYINVFNALTQVPKGGLVFMSGHRSYWYLPDEK
ncbi:MAG: DUF3267 domain-containing protein [Ruminococcus sp.]|nr:DUF3267 domain-containing protein [Ruminococcus sp.]